MRLSRFARVAAALAAALLLSGPSASGQDEDREELEREFRAALSGATLEGAFTASDAPEGTPPTRERYTIRDVRKLRDDLWQFTARIEYGGRDVTVPIPIEVKWAGDTPVLTLTDLPIPGLGTFTARVLIHRGQYAGTWSGGDHGGHLFGRVVPAAAPADGGEGGGDADDEQVRAAEGAWPQFRGRFARGWADGRPLPETFDVETGENVRFRVPLPGLAHSSPIVYGDRLFVTCAERIGDDGEQDLKVGLYGDIGSVEDEGPHRFTLRCLDRRTGAERWSRVCFEGVPQFPRHPKSSFAASTPATDGERVVAWFGSEGLHAFSMDGEPLWRKDLGPVDAGFFRVPDAQWGVATSPVLFEGKLILQSDALADSFLLALDAATGEELWRTARDDVPTWSTPTVHVGDGRRQVICNGFQHIGGYDLDTGEELWILQGGGDIPVPTPIVGDGRIFVTNAHGTMAPIYAIRTDAEGDLLPDDEESDGVDWFLPRRGNYMQTPLLHDGRLYLAGDSGVLSCLEAASGETVYRQRLGSGSSGFSASVVAGDGKLYATSEEGVVYVVELGEEFILLDVNELGETCMATPAISDGVIYFRTRGHLVAVATDAG